MKRSFVRTIHNLIDRIPRPAWGGLAFLCASFIIAMGQRPANRIPRLNYIPNLDKLLHGLAYAGLASLVLRALVPRRASQPVPGGLLAWLAVVVLPSLVGVADELLQGWAQRGRSSDVRDWLADTTGAAVVLAMAAWHRHQVRAREGR
ncbi:hypothetical protein GC173_15880 [bacterium]|nr:hypothetical protein [bacterium]